VILSPPRSDPDAMVACARLHPAPPDKLATRLARPSGSWRAGPTDGPRPSDALTTLRSPGSLVFGLSPLLAARRTPTTRATLFLAARLAWPGRLFGGESVQ